MKFRSTTRLAAAAAILLLTVLSACTSGGSAGSGTGSGGSEATIPLLRVGFDLDLTSLDNTKVIDADQLDQMGLEQLLKFGPQGQVEPNLATSWSQTSPVTYVYHLRHDVKFWDGHPLTATDVAYSLNYERAPGSQVAFGFSAVKSIVATDPYTVTVTLTAPYAGWQYVPAEGIGMIFEKAFQQAHQATFGHAGTLVMGSGPWIINSLDPTKGATMTANPHWWGGKVPIQRVDFTFYSTETSEALAFRAGEIDIDPSVSALRSFASVSGAKLLTTPSCGNAFYVLNVTTPYWSDVHVRRAFAYALNRTDLIAAYGGYAQPLYTLTPPQLLRSVASQSQVNTLLSSIPLYQYNLAKAKQEMAESAYPQGFTTTVLSINDNQSLDVSQVIAAEEAKIGIKLQIKQMPVVPWQGLTSGPQAKRMTTLSGGGCFQPDPGTFSDFLGSQNLQVGSWNQADYAPPAVDTLLAQGEATSNPGERFSIYSKVFARLQDDLPYVGLYVLDEGAALSSKFTWPGYSEWTQDGPFLLQIKPVA
jgi:peptide/nickel transport system substrate-binding protein